MQAVDALAELHEAGINARMIVRGGREPYGDLVFARAHERGLNVETDRLPRARTVTR